MMGNGGRSVHEYHSANTRRDNVAVHTPALPETQELANIKNKLEK